MFEEISHPASLRPQELEAVYAISKAVAGAVDIDAALDEIIYLARPVFIFDNMVLYLKRGSDTLELAYARAIGRGRSQEAELVWGEATAYEVVLNSHVTIRTDGAEDMSDRTQLRYSLGLPLRTGNEIKGAVVFIRFGGPTYKPDQIRLAEFIGMHVGQLLEHDQLVDKIVALEAERRLDRLQEDFIATVSHELLTPLGFIKGYATTLLRDDATWDEDTMMEFLVIIDEEADRLRELIDNLMDSSRLQGGTLRMSFQPVRIDIFLKDLISRAKSRDSNNNITLDLKIPELVLSVDPARLAQVFDNLLSNAAKYAPGAAIDISLSQENQFAHIMIHDNGPGIAAEHIPNLFKRFYRVPTKNVSVRGTGLGLFISRQIVRAHGGQISVEFENGQGTTFHIDLPFKREHEQKDISLRESN